MTVRGPSDDLCLSGGSSSGLEVLFSHTSDGRHRMPRENYIMLPRFLVIQITGNPEFRKSGDLEDPGCRQSGVSDLVFIGFPNFEICAHGLVSYSLSLSW